jgi:hypothetical protein
LGEPRHQREAQRTYCAAREPLRPTALPTKEMVTRGEWRSDMIGRIGAIVLIVVGAVFLLNNLGMTHLSIREIARTWWPALLIIAGLSLLIRRRSR